jgi:hypothetical protein
VLIINVVLVAWIFISMRHVFLTLKVRAPPMSKEHILPTGRPQPVREPLDFEPRKPRIRVQQPMKRQPDPRSFRPVPKDLLLPGTRPRR